MIERNYKRVAYFYDRTIAHIKSVILIQEFMNKMFDFKFKVNYHHDATKFFLDCEEGYFLMTFKYLGEKLTDEEERECKEAWFHHYVNESHHPEYTTFNRHISLMEKSDMFEMVCDWLAMSYEFHESDWMEFWREKMSKKFEWSQEQRIFIEKMLKYAERHKREIVTLLDKNVKFPSVWK